MGRFPSKRQDPELLFSCSRANSSHPPPICFPLLFGSSSRGAIGAIDWGIMGLFPSARVRERRSLGLTAVKPSERQTQRTTVKPSKRLAVRRPN